MNENEHEHIIKFKYIPDLYNNLDINDDFYIKSYTSSKNININSIIDIHYNNLNINEFSFLKYNYNYIFNISNMLYKLHTKDYYCRFCHNCKELI